MTTQAQLIDALEDTWRSLDELVSTFDDADWERATSCPGWSVKDQLSHIAGVESHLLGRPQPEHELPEGLDHVTNDWGRFMEVDIDARRAWPPAQIVDEFREVAKERLAYLRGLPDDLDQFSPSVFGAEVPLSRSLPIRVFDCWAHEQDIRRALDRPGHLSGIAPEVARDRTLRGWSIVWSTQMDPPLSDGTTIVVDVTGPSATTRTITVSGGRGDLSDELPAQPDVTLTMPLDALVRLGCGRTDADPTEVDVAGDSDVAARLIAAMAVTP